MSRLYCVTFRPVRAGAESAAHVLAEGEEDARRKAIARVYGRGAGIQIDGHGFTVICAEHDRSTNRSAELFAGAITTTED